MTDRYAGYVVTLQNDVREDDAEDTINAIRQIKGVVGVQPVRVTPELQIAEERARAGIIKRLYSAMNPEKA